MQKALTKSAVDIRTQAESDLIFKSLHCLGGLMGIRRQGQRGREGRAGGPCALRHQHTGAPRRCQRAPVPGLGLWHPAREAAATALGHSPGSHPHHHRLKPRPPRHAALPKASLGVRPAGPADFWPWEGLGVVSGGEFRGPRRLEISLFSSDHPPRVRVLRCPGELGREPDGRGRAL